mmetsp:Transcript_62525/g.196021  ORF Transcript_62525/g.196021 Transcript_62525/m.196021 type:complete len:264 (-) Transcript_62525:305-1096(-)
MCLRPLLEGGLQHDAACPGKPRDKGHAVVPLCGPLAEHAEARTSSVCSFSPASALHQQLRAHDVRLGDEGVELAGSQEVGHSGRQGRWGQARPLAAVVAADGSPVEVAGLALVRLLQDPRAAVEDRGRRLQPPVLAGGDGHLRDLAHPQRGPEHPGPDGSGAAGLHVALPTKGLVLVVGEGLNHEGPDLCGGARHCLPSPDVPECLALCRDAASGQDHVLHLLAIDDAELPDQLLGLRADEAAELRPAGLRVWVEQVHGDVGI